MTSQTHSLVVRMCSTGESMRIVIDAPTRADAIEIVRLTPHLTFIS